MIIETAASIGSKLKCPDHGLPCSETDLLSLPPPRSSPPPSSPPHRVEEHATQEASLKLREQLLSHEKELVKSQNEWLSR